MIFTIEALSDEKEDDSDIEDSYHYRNNNNDNNNNNNINNNNNNNNDYNSNNKKYKLQSSGRIAHSYNFIKMASLQAKFKIIEISKAIPRYDRGQPVEGYLVVLKKEKNGEKDIKEKNEKKEKILK